MEASELIFTDESGTYLTHFRDLDPERQRPLAHLSDLETLLSRVKLQCVQLPSFRPKQPGTEKG